MASDGPFPPRRTAELQRGRISNAGASYFLTLITRQRTSWLSSPAATRATLDALHAWHDEHDGVLLAASVMPDHLHALIQLGEKLSLGQLVGRVKSAVRRSTGFSRASDWQRNFWEHQLRDENPEEFALYIFLNPYRARLISPDENWPGWWAPDPTKFRFSSKLINGRTPPPEWIDWPEDRFSHLSVGE